MVVRVFDRKYFYLGSAGAQIELLTFRGKPRFRDPWGEEKSDYGFVTLNQWASNEQL